MFNMRFRYKSKKDTIDCLQTTININDDYEDYLNLGKSLDSLGGTRAGMGIFCAVGYQV